MSIKTNIKEAIKIGAIIHKLRIEEEEIFFIKRNENDNQEGLEILINSPFATFKFSNITKIEKHAAFNFYRIRTDIDNTYFTLTAEKFIFLNGDWVKTIDEPKWKKLTGFFDELVREFEREITIEDML